MNIESGNLAGEPLALEGPDTRNVRRRRWLIAGAVLIAVIVAVAVWMSGAKTPAAPQASAGDQAPSVSFVVPGRAAVANAISATGTLAAKRDMPVGVAGEGGEVTRVLVEPGQWVAAGQVLATVDRSVQAQTAASLNAQIGVAQSDLVLAQSELERAQQLVDRQFISKADVQRRIAARDAAAARLKVARATASEQSARNRRLDIRAPAAGLILTRQVEPGQIVGAASGILFRIAQGGQMEMRAQLAESDLVTLRPGVAASVTPVGDVKSFEGRVWQVSPVIDPQTRQGIARIQLSYDPALRPGGFASARITAGASQAPQLPQSAILSDDKGNYVYVIGKDDKVERRNVRLGTVTETDVAVAEGLTGTERVVFSAGAFLNPGQKVKPVLHRAEG